MKTVLSLLFILFTLTPVGAQAEPGFYFPDYPFAFSCRASISDEKVEYIPGEGYRRYFAEAEFQLDNENTGFESEKITWKWMKEVGDDIFPTEKPENAFNMTRHWGGLWFFAGETPAKDVFRLNLEVYLPLGDYAISDISYGEGTAEIKAMAAAKAVYKDKFPYHLYLSVKCKRTL